MGVPPLRAGSGYAVLPLVGAVHHASRRVPTIPHARVVSSLTQEPISAITSKNGD
jgi:hypothetical protein